MEETSIIIDHVRGSRRGQRQELAAATRVRFGRHPDCNVIFHPSRDLDASSRHAELCCEDGRHVLRDVGSFHGTLVHGQPITELALAAGEPVEVEFGRGGPVVRIFIGPRDQAPAPVRRSGRLRGPALLLLAAALLLGAGLVALVAWGSPV